MDVPPEKLPQSTIETILASRKVGRPELCIEKVESWLRALTRWYTRDEALRDDLTQECLLYFLETVYRWIEPREAKSVRASLEILMNRRMYCYMREHRMKSGVKLERLRPKMQFAADFSEVYVREIWERNRPRQRQVIELLMEGLSSAEAARILGTSERTINELRATMAV